MRHSYRGDGPFHAKPANASNRHRSVDYDDGTYIKESCLSVCPSVRMSVGHAKMKGKRPPDLYIYSEPGSPKDIRA